MHNERFTFALCTETRLVRPRDLQLAAFVCEVNARHCAKAWSVPAPAVVLGTSRDLPKHFRPVVCLADDSRNLDALAVHYVDPVRGGPASRAYVDRASGFRTGPFSIIEAITHEILEMLVNPYLDLWYDYPAERSARVQVAGEVGDPVQDTYDLLHAGVKWPVANFVTPHWFAADLADPGSARTKAFFAGGGYVDHAKTLRAAGELGPEGYAVFRSKGVDGRWNQWTESGSARKARGDLPATVTGERSAAHPWSRSLQLRLGSGGRVGAAAKPGG